MRSRRPHAHDRVRLPVRALRLHPAGRLPRRLPDARGTGSAFARSFADNNALRLFYGYPHDLLTVSGYSAWRVGGTLAIARRGLRAARRRARAAHRGGGRPHRAVLAARVGRSTAYLSAIAAIAAGIVILWLARDRWASSPAACRRRARPTSRWRPCRSVPVFVGVGALASQLAPTRRARARARRRRPLRSRCCCASSPTPSRRGWLRWATPLGWAEELRPFAGAAAAGAAAPRSLASAAAARGARLGSPSAGTSAPGCCRPRSAEPRLRCSPRRPRRRCAASAAASVVWAAGVGAFALHPRRGLARASPRPASPRALQQRAREARHRARSSRPAGYLAFVFIFFVLAVSLFACAQVGAARHEEAEERLETLLALPVGRRALARRPAAARRRRRGAISLAAGLLAWVGRRLAGRRRLAAADARGRRQLPAGRAAVPRPRRARLRVAPRASAGIAYGARHGRVPVAARRLAARRAAAGWSS